MPIVAPLNVIWLPIFKGAMLAVLEEKPSDVAGWVAGLDAESLHKLGFAKEFARQTEFFLHFRLSLEKIRLVAIWESKLDSLDADIVPVSPKINLSQA